MMRRRDLLVTAATGVALIALPIDVSRANHIKIDGHPQPAAPPSAPPAASQTLHADHITALRVRADTIYANRIEADEHPGPDSPDEGRQGGRDAG